MLLSAAGSAHAQAAMPAGLQVLEDEQPPAAEVLQRPAAATSADGSTEKRLPGARVTEIEVRRGASTYYLQPQSPAGGARSGGTAQWNVLNFDFGRKTATAAPAETAPVPPPPRQN